MESITPNQCFPLALDAATLLFPEPSKLNPKAPKVQSLNPKPTRLLIRSSVGKPTCHDPGAQELSTCERLETFLPAPVETDPLSEAPEVGLISMMHQKTRPQFERDSPLA